jgi:hypothetical protein
LKGRRREEEKGGGKGKGREGEREGRRRGREIGKIGKYKGSFSSSVVTPAWIMRTSKRYSSCTSASLTSASSMERTQRTSPWLQTRSFTNSAAYISMASSTRSS